MSFTSSRLCVCLGTAVLVGSLFVAEPAAAGGAVHETEDVTGDAFVCESGIYTITSGELKITFHEGSSTSGNQNFTVTITPTKLIATNGEDTYSVRGALWFGGTFNAQQGTGQETFTGKLQIVSRGGGTVGSVNLTFHASPNGTVKDFDFGSCVLP